MVHAESQIAGLGLDAHLLRFIKQRVAAKVWWGEGHTAALSDACQPMAPRASPLPLCAQVALAVSDETTLTLSAEAGVLLPWGARAWSSRTSISDRFFLGGIGAGGALRGFTQKGVGPTDARRKVRRRGPCVPAVVGLRRGGCASQRALHAHPQAEARERDALGGDVFCSVLAALNFQLPHEGLRATGCHGQLFVNGGTIAALSGTGRGLQQCVHELVTSFRWSVVSAPGRHQGGGGRRATITSRAARNAGRWAGFAHTDWAVGAQPVPRAGQPGKRSRKGGRSVWVCRVSVNPGAQQLQEREHCKARALAPAFANWAKGHGSG